MSKLPMVRMTKATAQQDCAGRLLAHEQVYAEWLSRETNKDGGLRVINDDSTRLASDRCSVCAGHCPSPEACHLPMVESYGMGWSLGWLAFFAAVGVGCLVMAVVVGMP